MFCLWGIFVRKFGISSLVGSVLARVYTTDQPLYSILLVNTLRTNKIAMESFLKAPLHTNLTRKKAQAKTCRVRVSEIVVWSRQIFSSLM